MPRGDTCEWVKDKINIKETDRREKLLYENSQNKKILIIIRKRQNIINELNQIFSHSNPTGC